MIMLSINIHKVFYFLSIILLFIVSSSIQIKGQNLINNWSFEDTIPCIKNPVPGSVETSPPWASISQSTDYFNQIYNCWSVIAFGNQSPRTGFALVGSGLYSLFSGPNSNREVFGQPLPDTLIQGHKYCVSFYVSL